MELIELLQRMASPGLDSFMMTVTNLANDLVYVALLVVAYLGFGPAQGRRLGIMFLVSMYANGLLKDLFSTERPFQIDPSVLRVPEAVDTAGGHGFPSGHAQSTATFWGVAARLVGRTWFTVLALLIIVLVSLSRMYLGVHLPIDIVGGLALGLLAVLLLPLLMTKELPWPAWLQMLLALLLPLAFHLLLPTGNSGILLGGLSGFLLAPLLFEHRPPKSLAGRILVTAIGLALVFAVLLGSSALLPEAVKRNEFVDFFRYLVIALVGLVGAPALTMRWLVR